MPVLTCPHCRAISQLPDPWYAPGFTCHHCRQPVTISHPVAPPPAPFADMTDGEPVIASKPRPRRERGEATSAFWTAFGGTLGHQVANGLVTMFVLALLAVGCYFLWPHVSFLFNWMRK